MNARKIGVFYYMSKYLRMRNDLANKVVVDIPSGKGRVCEVLKSLGAKVSAFDIFPEQMKVPEVQSNYADMNEQLPISDGYADFIVCQEGIEHIQNQLGAFREFNRILKTNGELLLTTPNISNFVGKLSNLINEGELLRYLPPSEIDGIWFSDNSYKIYLGHFFLIGIQRLRNLAILSGFEIKEINRTEISRSSVILSLFLYPIVIFFSTMQLLRTYKRFRKRNNTLSVMWQQYLLGISPKILFSKHLFIVFAKKRTTNQNISYLKSVAR